MTSVAHPAGRRLAAFAVASEPGNERVALARVAEAVAGCGLTGARLERLKTAVAEATMNAIEHGNRSQPDIPVDVEVTQDGADIIVAITDRGGEHAGAGTAGAGTTGAGTVGAEPAADPDLDLKLAGQQPPRGWGLFLIRNMVDAMRVSTEGPWHTIQLTMRTGAGAPGADLPGGGQ